MGDGNPDFFEQVIDGEVGVAHLDGRIEQARGADDLVDKGAAGLREFVVVGGGTDVDDLPRQGLKLFKLQRTIVQRCGQAEAVAHEGLLARAVAAVHGTDLRDGDVTFINDDEKIFRKEVEQAVRTCAGGASVEIARIVFDARTVTEFAYHLYVVVHTLFEALGFEVFVLLLEPLHLLHEVVLDLADGEFLRFFGGEEEVGGVDFIFVKRTDTLPRKTVDLFDAVDFVAPEVDAQHIVGVSEEDVHRVALHAEVAALRCHVVAGVEAVHQAAQEDIHRDTLAGAQEDDVFVECRGVAHTVDAAHRRHHHHIFAPREQSRSSRQAEFVKVVVDGEVFFDISVGRGNVGFGLIVVIVGDVVLHRVVGEEALHLGVELGRQRFVVGKDKGGFTNIGNDVGDGEGFSRACHAEEHLCRFAGLHAFRELADGFGLVAHRAVRGGELKSCHNVLLWGAG